MSITIKKLVCGHEVGDFISPGPNSAGGVSVYGQFVNNSPKTIKYITLRFIPYNQVGDAVGCSIKNCSEFGLKCTGPVAPNRSHNFIGENLWYNYSITSVKVSRVEIQYMDGTEETIQGSNLTSPAPASGCYVATAVYGSYDCPEVWTLRRFRDYDLAETWYGRTFVSVYYAVSPFFVRHFGETKWFKKMWRGKLDRMVSRLQAKGYESTPYEDRIW